MKTQSKFMKISATPKSTTTKSHHFSNIIGSINKTDLFKQDNSIMMKSTRIFLKTQTKPKEFTNKLNQSNNNFSTSITRNSNASHIPGFSRTSPRNFQMGNGINSNKNTTQRTNKANSNTKRVFWPSISNSTDKISTNSSYNKGVNTNNLSINNNNNLKIETNASMKTTLFTYNKFTSPSNSYFNNGWTTSKTKYRLGPTKPQINTSNYSIHYYNMWWSEYHNCYSPAKYSSNPFDIIECYGWNTYQGIVRNYNEDRVLIILDANYKNKANLKNKVSYFAVFDGHAGKKCADYVKTNFHTNLFNSDSFPESPWKAIEEACALTETNFINSLHNNNSNIYYDYSGSCALITLIIDNRAYVINLGDSRALYSYNSGQEWFQVTRDQKPNDPFEKKRILNAGGGIYQTAAPPGIPMSSWGFTLPYRILPGKWSVARAFGDVEAKISSLGGNNKVLISKPCVYVLDLDEKSDFILMGCDGIYDRLKNEEIFDTIWRFKQKDTEITNIHEHSGKICDAIIKLSLRKWTSDNVSCIFIGFKNFKNWMGQIPFEYQSQKNGNCMVIQSVAEIDLSS